MIHMAYSFFILALIALLLGATGVAGISMEIARLLLIAFVAIGGVTLLYALMTGRKPPRIP